MRAIPQVAFQIVRDKEKLVLYAYDDQSGHYPPPVANPGDTIHGKLTAGYGHTGAAVTIGMSVDEDLAEQWLEEDLTSAGTKLEAKGGADAIAGLTDNQYGALLDFVFNLGTGNPNKPEWTIWRRLRAKDYERVPVEMGKFVNATVKDADGNEKVVKLEALVDRRNAETGLWAVAEPGTQAQVVSSSVTRANPTPPTPSAPGRSKALITGAIGAITGAGPMMDKVSHAIAPYAEHSHYVESALGVLAAIAAVSAGFAVFYVAQQARNARN